MDVRCPPQLLCGAVGVSVSQELLFEPPHVRNDPQRVILSLSQVNNKITFFCLQMHVNRDAEDTVLREGGGITLYVE